MRKVAQGVNDQVVEVFEQCGGGFRKGTEIGEISGAAETKAEHLKIAMQQRHGHEGNTHEFERAGDDAQIHAGDAALLGDAVKDVSKGAAQDAEGFFGAVDGQGRFLANVEGANVVETENVVGVPVGEQDGVKAIESNTQGLLAEVGSGVDD